MSSESTYKLAADNINGLYLIEDIYMEDGEYQPEIIEDEELFEYLLSKGVPATIHCEVSEKMFFKLCDIYGVSQYEN